MAGSHQGNAALESFIADRTAVFELSDGTPITFRPTTSADRRHLIEGFSRLSDTSVYSRFLRPMPVLSESELSHLLAVDQIDHMAWAAFTNDGVGIGVARYIRDADDPARAEAAVTVVDEYQHRGVATILVGLLAESALENGIAHFVAYALPDNEAVIESLELAGATAIARDDYAVTFEIELPVDGSQFSNSPLRAALRAVAVPHD